VPTLAGRESVSVPLLEWSNRSAKATALRDRAELDRAAAEFDVIIRDVLTQTRSTGGTGGRSVTVDLLREQVHGRPLTDDELVSMLRNWTVGELGTIAAAVGIICEFLARRDDVRARLRSGMDQRALDEMLRLEAPVDQQPPTYGPVSDSQWGGNARRRTRHDRLACCPA
jgi:cytochrome P450